MKITQVSEGITQLALNLEDMLFEGLWEIPNGVSLNSYIVKGRDTAIIDGFCGWDGVPESLYKLLDDAGVTLSSIKYLVVNHLEPDHAGWIEDFRKITTDFEVICTQKGADLLDAFFGGGLNVRTVKSNDTLDLGNGRQLIFRETPHVHWPDAMVTFDSLSGTLFSCDAFGSFGRIDGSPFEDDYTDEELAIYEEDTIRYYSNIVGAFSAFVAKAVDQCSDLDIKLIAPGHGLMWRKRIPKIIKDYLDYAAYHKGPARQEITLLWGSMYGMTERAVQAAIKELEGSGIKFHVLQVPQAHWGEIIAKVWISSAVILAMPTYEYKMFPPMAAALEELGKKKAFGKKAFRFGSYGWSGGAQRELDDIMDKFKMKWDFVDPVEFKGQASQEDIMQIRQQVQNLVNHVKAQVAGI